MMRHLGLAIFLFLLAFSTGAFAQTLKVVKVYPQESKIIVDQGTSAGFNANARVDLLSESGLEIKTKVTKSTAGKAILLVPTNKLKSFKAGQVYTYGIVESAGSVSESPRKKGKDKKSSSPFVELEVNPTAMILSQLDGGLHLRLMENFTIGFMYITYMAESVKGSGFGGEARYYIDKAFTDFFIGVGAFMERATLSDKTVTTDTVETTPTDTYGLLGYNWVIGSNFQAVFGAGVRYYMAPASINKTETGTGRELTFSNPLSGVNFIVRGALALTF